MGYNYDAGFLEMTDFDTALTIHCTTNCYPPIHTDFIPAFKDAIDAMMCDEPSTQISLPNGHFMSARSIVDSARLWAFVDYLFDLGRDGDE